jgi:phosphoglycerol transferase MdoB-like AlkP superfamily enzyme
LLTKIDMKYLSPYSLAFKVIFTALTAFTMYRLCFLGFNHHSIPEHPDHAAYLYYRSFILGVNFDLVITCYLIAPFIIFLFIRQVAQQSVEKGLLFFRWYFTILFSVCLFICAADIPYFKQFATHLNRDAFNWASSPGFVFSLIFSSFSYWGFLILFVLLVTFGYKRFSKIFSNVHAPLALPKWKSLLVFLFLAFFTFIGIRGRTALKSPIHVGTAFFSEHAFFNQLGLNPCFVFFHSLKQEKEWALLQPPVDEKELQTGLAQISNRTPSATSISRTYTTTGSPLKYNVILVLMESMSMTKMGHHHCSRLTNRFDTIAQQGLFFNRFYSSGIHTFNGLFSTETGFPSILNTQPLETYTGKAFKGISYWLKQNGYSNYFFTSNDGQFDNMEGFMKFNHFENFYSHEDYPSDKVISTMGVPDHYLLEFALKKMDTHLQEKNTPFFSYILTSSDHGPWAVPTDIPFKPTAESEQDRATQYADWAIGHFIDQAKKYTWFDNTLFIFLGDHGVNFGHTYAMPLSFHHIPCVFYMPSKIKPDKVSNIGGQIDVLPTLLSFLNIPFNNTSMGIDLLHENRPWMYYTADSKIGAIDQNFYYFNLLEEQKEVLHQYKDLDTKNYLDTYKSKADSMKNYSHRMIRIANHIIKNKLY